jgi:hypothetical protein
MATYLDALAFREIFGRTLRRPESGSMQAFIVAPVQDSMDDKEFNRMVRIVNQSLIRCIDYGEVFYVSREMTEFLMRIVNEQMQHVEVFHIDVGDLPSLTGFVYFDGPIPMPTIYSPTGFQNMTALLWDQFATTTSKDVDEPHLYYGGSAGIENAEVVGKIIYSVCEAPNAQQRSQSGRWKTRHWIPAMFGEHMTADMVNYTENDVLTRDNSLSADEIERDRADSKMALGILLKLLTLWVRVIQQEIPVRHPSEPRHDKVMAREGRPPAIVKVTHLRRYAETTTAGAGLVDVDWAYRWEVRGHFRNQRVGPGRSLIKKVWVPKHIKGPADKPLVIRDTVTSLDR